MALMSCDDKNEFLFICVLIASRIHNVSFCDAMTSAKKSILLVASEDFTNLYFHTIVGVTPL